MNVDTLRARWKRDCACVDGATDLPLALKAGACADVLAQEARWLTAITSGDVATVDSVLGPTYRHVNADGEMFGRARGVATTERLDVAGDQALRNWQKRK